MDNLIKSVEGQVLDNFVSDVDLLNYVDASVDSEPYINISGFEAYLQDFTKADSITDITKPTGFGLKHNREITTLNISY